MATAAGITASGAISAAAPAAGGLGTRFVHIQRAPVQFGAIQMRDSRLGIFGFRHFDKCEAAGLARFTIRYDVDAFHAAIYGKGAMQLLLRGLITEISDKYVGHSIEVLCWLIIFVRLRLKPTGRRK
jgi:hypothetical protein